MTKQGNSRLCLIRSPPVLDLYKLWFAKVTQMLGIEDGTREIGQSEREYLRHVHAAFRPVLIGSAGSIKTRLRLAS